MNTRHILYKILQYLLFFINDCISYTIKKERDKIIILYKLAITKEPMLTNFDK